MANGNGTAGGGDEHGSPAEAAGSPGRSARDLRTRLAAEAVDLGNLFASSFRSRVIAGSPPRRPVLVGTSGMSTGGGRQARQNISLVPVDGREGPPLVVGWADPSTDTAELRTWRSVIDTFTERSGGRELALDNITYSAFVRDAMGFFEAAGFRCGLSGRRSVPPAAPPTEGLSTKRVVLLLAAFLLVGLALGSGVVLLLTR